MRLTIPLAGLAFTAGALLCAPHAAHALTMKECSTQYQAAKTANTLNGQDWKAFRATHCSATATAIPTATTPATIPAAPAPTAPATTAAAPAPMPATQAAKPGMATTTAPASTGPAVFPAHIDPKYASLKAGTGRMKTCDDQYKANKATGGNGNMKWIQKGGGYYSACSKHLKGA